MTAEQILKLHMQRAASNHRNDEDVLALLSEVEQLRDALKYYADKYNYMLSCAGDGFTMWGFNDYKPDVYPWERARSALYQEVKA